MVCAHLARAILAKSQSSASFGLAARGSSGSVRASRSNRQVRMPIVGRPFLSASATSDSVPSPPPRATTPSAVLASTALRPWPRLVAIAMSIYPFASFGSSPGSRPMVKPPPARAPRAACSITPVSPPQITTASRSAMPRPSSKARSASDVRGSDSPQTAIRRRRELNEYELYSSQRDNARLLEVPDADLGRELRGDLAIDRSQGRVWFGHHERHARTAALADTPIQRDLAQEGDFHPFGQHFGAAVAKNVFSFAAVRTREVAHVLDQPEVGHLERVEHLDGPADVGRGHVLRRRDHDGARHRDALRHGQLHVAGSWWQIDDQVIQLAPVDVEQELLDGAGEHRPAPDGRLVSLDEERNGYQLDAVALDGNDLVVLRVRFFALGAEQDRHVRPVDVGVEDARPGTQLRQREGQIHGGGGLSDATFAGANRHDVLDTLDLLHLRDRAGAGDLSVPLDLCLRRPGQRREGGVDIVMDAVLQGAGGRGQHHTHHDGPGINQLDVLDHLELDHPAVKLRIFHRAERRKHNLFSQLRDGHRIDLTSWS